MALQMVNGLSLRFNCNYHSMKAEELANQITGRYLSFTDALNEIKTWVKNSYGFEIEVELLKKCIDDAKKPNAFEILIHDIMVSKK